MEQKLLGWTLEEFAVAAEVYRAETGKGPLSTLEGALDVQAHYIATHGTAEVLPELHPYHTVPADLGWARALFSKMKAALEEKEEEEAHHADEDTTGVLAACPCGEVPKELFIADGGQGGKWTWVYGGCCGEWHIEFRAEYNDLESEKCKDLAREAWNEAPRMANSDK